MTDDSSARNQSAVLSSVDADYDAIHAAIVATERGRWFLEEYARRNRAADTGLVLAAVERIEQAIRGGTTEPSHARPPSDVVAIAEAIGKARVDAVGRHGDPAAIGDAALGDFRNAVEQIQELVWDMHGRDAASELGSQLSLQTNRLTSAGDRIERSLGGLRILLALVDDLEQRLSPLVGASMPAAPPRATETSTAEPLAEAGYAVEAIQHAERPTPIRSVVTPEMEWPQPSPEGAVETAGPQPEPASELAQSEEDRVEPEPSAPAPQFEPLWAIHEARAEDVAHAAEGEPEAGSAPEWTFQEPAPIAQVQDGAPPLPDVMSEPQPRHVEPYLPPPETRPYAHWHEAATVASPPAAEGTALPAAPPQPELAHRDEAAVDTSPVQDETAGIVVEEAAELSTAAFVETSGGASSAIEWFEIPAADAAGPESTFDADLFDNDDERLPATASVQDSAIDSLQAKEATADERQAVVKGAAAEDIDWLMAEDNAETTNAAAEPTVTAARNEIDALFSDPAPIRDEPAQPALANLQDVSAKSTEPSADSTREDSPPMELPSKSAAAASLYTDTSYSQPARSVGVHAARAYAQHTNGQAEQNETAPPKPAAAAYDWPPTFAREATKDSASDRSSAGSRASAAYDALQSQSFHTEHTEPPAAQAPAPDAGASGPFAEEEPDVPSVIERLESVRSAIAALMEEVSEKGPRRTGTSRL